MLALQIRHVGMIPVPVATSQKFRWVLSDSLQHNADGNSSGSTFSSPHSRIRNTELEGSGEERTVVLKSQGRSVLGFNIVDTKSGVFVSTVKQNTPSDAAGIVAGDEILQVNDVVFRKATTPEIVLALKHPGDLVIVLRASHGLKSRSPSSVAINFSDPDFQNNNEIESKIDQLFETNLAKRAEQIRTEVNGRTPESRASEEIQLNRRESPPLPPPPPPHLIASHFPTITEHENYKKQKENMTVTNENLTLIPVEPVHSQNSFQTFEVDTTDGVVTTAPMHSGEKTKMKSNTVEMVVSPTITEFSVTSWRKLSKQSTSNSENNDGEEETNQRALAELRAAGSRRQKLEAELRERLKIERQKRLVQEKSLRLDRLRQELKETEREEARLQKWLADSENSEDIHHTLGSYAYDSSGEVFNEVPPAEFALTTPPDLRQRTNSAAPVSSTHDGRQKITEREALTSASEIRFEKEIDGRKIVISEVKKHFHATGTNIPERKVNFNRVQTVTEPASPRQQKISTSPGYSRVNVRNEITFF